MKEPFCDISKRKEFEMEKVKDTIVEWLKNQKAMSNTNGFVVGVSGGVDSAVVSTLCALTSLPTYVLSLPIETNKFHLVRANTHLSWLKERFPFIKTFEIDLTKSCNRFEDDIWPSLFLEAKPENEPNLVSANIKSRLRMIALYAFANAKRLLVAGTGNKVEDYGIGFFTKGGDGLIDISPIGDLMKSEVRKLASYLEIKTEIVNAIPSDGLWSDGRSDEDQIGATYDELEWAMNYLGTEGSEKLTGRKLEVLNLYLKRHNENAHKMSVPPICRIYTKEGESDEKS